MGDGKVDETEGGQGEGTRSKEGSHDDSLPTMTGASEEEPGGDKDGSDKDGEPTQPLSQDSSVNEGIQGDRGEATKDGTSIDVSQAYDAKPDDQGSQGKGNQVQASAGKQVPKGWLIARLFATRIVPFVVRTFVPSKQGFIDGHFWGNEIARCRWAVWRAHKVVHPKEGILRCSYNLIGIKMK